MFAWGATMVFAATGRRAFPGSTFSAVALAVLHKEPELDGLEGGLAEIVRACLEKDPTKRPTAAELSAHLRELHPLKPDPKPKPQPSPLAKPEPAPEPKPKPKPTPTPTPEPKPESEPEPESKPEPEPEPKAKPEPELEPESEPKPESEAKPASVPMPAPALEPEREGEPEPEPEGSEAEETEPDQVASRSGGKRRRRRVIVAAALAVPALIGIFYIPITGANEDGPSAASPNPVVPAPKPSTPTPSKRPDQSPDPTKSKSEGDGKTSSRAKPPKPGSSSGREPSKKPPDTRPRNLGTLSTQDYENYCRSHGYPYYVVFADQGVCSKDREGDNGTIVSPTTVCRWKHSDSPNVHANGRTCVSDP